MSNNKYENNLTLEKNQLNESTYDVKAVYNGNYKYLASQNSIKFSVDKLNTTIAVNANDIVYGQNAIIEVVLDNDATGNVTININDVNTTSEIINGKAIFKTSGICRAYR